MKKQLDCKYTTLQMVFLESFNKGPGGRVQVIFEWSLIRAIVLLKHSFLKLFRSLYAIKTQKGKESKAESPLVKKLFDTCKE